MKYIEEARQSIEAVIANLEEGESKHLLITVLDNLDDIEESYEIIQLQDKQEVVR